MTHNSPTELLTILIMHAILRLAATDGLSLMANNARQMEQPLLSSEMIHSSATPAACIPPRYELQFDRSFFFLIVHFCVLTAARATEPGLEFVLLCLPSHIIALCSTLCPLPALLDPACGCSSHWLYRLESVFGVFDTYKSLQLRYRLPSAPYHDHLQQKPWTLAPVVFHAYAECCV